jgi:hypothetical protein
MQVPNSFLIWEEVLVYAYTSLVVDSHGGDLEKLAPLEKPPNNLYDPPSLAYYLY